MSHDGAYLGCGGPKDLKLVRIEGLLERPGRVDLANTLPGNHSIVALSPDGRNAATTQDHKIFLNGFHLGRMDTHRLFHEAGLDSAHEDTIDHVEFSADGSLLASSSPDGSVKIWEVASGRPIISLNLDGLGRLYATFSPDGKTLVVTTAEKTIVYELAGSVAHVAKGHDPKVIRAFALSTRDSTGSDLACVTDEWTDMRHTEVTRWDTRRSQCVGALTTDLPHGPTPIAAGVTWKPNSRTLLLNRPAGILLWEGERPDSVRQIPAPCPSSLIFAHDGAQLWGTIDDERRVMCWLTDRFAPSIKPWTNALAQLAANQSGLTSLCAGTAGS